MLVQLLISTLITFPLLANDRDIAEDTRYQCTMQMVYFVETLPFSVRGQVWSTLNETRPRLPKEDQDFTSWIVDCGPYINWQAWPTLIEEYKQYRCAQGNIHKPLLFQVLCARSNPSQRQSLFHLLSQQPAHVPSCVLLLAPNPTIEALAPQLKETNTTYDALDCMVKNTTDDCLPKHVIQGETSLLEAWRLLMKEQWDDHTQVLQATHSATTHTL